MFRNDQDYYAPLLELLASEFPNGGAPKDILARFAERYRDQIPDPHRTRNASGRERWHMYVRWARQYLVSEGLMDGSQWGRWALTDAGRERVRSGIAVTAQRTKGGPTLNDDGRPVGRSGEADAGPTVMFQAWRDYAAPLLRLLAGDSGQYDSHVEAAEAFYQQHEGVIPDRHREPVANGNPRWSEYLYWCKGTLVELGLMEPGRGVWAISDAGRTWLAENPGARRVAVAESEQPVETGMGAMEFLEDVKVQLAEALADSPPMEIRHPSAQQWVQIRYGKSWSVHYEVAVGRRQHEVALHFELAKDAAQQRLDAFLPHATRIESTMGQKVRMEPWSRTWTRVSIPLPVRALTPALAVEYAGMTSRFVASTLPILQKFEEAQAKSITPSMERDEYLRRLAGLLRERLAQQEETPSILHEDGRNYCEVRFRSFAGSRHFITIGRRVSEVGLYFYTTVSRAIERMQAFSPHVESLSRDLGRPVVAERFGSGWARVRIQWPTSTLDDASLDEHVRLFLRFIDLTVPILRDVHALRQRRPAVPKAGAGGPVTIGQPSAAQHAILDQEMTAIREFVQGHFAARPSDEKLCDWVCFCYTFGLYSEGRDIFSVVDQVRVNEWYYGRTKRLAAICRMKSEEST